MGVSTIRSARLAVVAMLFAAPLQASAQQAAWAQDSREPSCVFDGLLASANGAPLEPGRIGVIRDECRQRFGWTEDQTNRGTNVARILFEVMRTDREAREAGVDPALIDTVRQSFSAADMATLGIPGESLNDHGRRTIDQLSLRVAERGLSGETARKAVTAVLRQMMAQNIIAAFTSEVMPAPAP